jgi:hypothetical protein
MSPVETITSWLSLYLTLRLDPEYPRDTAALIAAARTGDIDLTGWTLAAQIAGTITSGTGGVMSFVLPRATALSELTVGRNRGVLDVHRVESGAEIQIVQPTWFSVLESVYDG